MGSPTLARMKPDKEQLDKWRNDPANWTGGVFYANAKDKRIFIPYRPPGFGWTLNFGNPLSVVVVVLIIAAALVISSVTNPGRLH